MKDKKIYKLILGFLLISLLYACGSRPVDEKEVEIESALLNYSSSVSASGIVVPQQWATLSLPVGGSVVKLLVAENDLVDEGQILLQLSGTERLEAAVALTNLEVISSQQAYNDLFDFRETSRALVAQSVAILRDTVKDTETRINNLNYPSSQENIDTANASLVLAENQLDKAKDNFEKFESKPENNIQRANALIALNRTQNAYDSALRNYNYTIGSADEYEIGKAEANLALAKTQLADAERNLEQMANGPDPDSVALVDARLKNSKAQKQAAEAALDNLTLRAPFAGTIGQINTRKYEWVNPGQPLIVLGDISTLQIETTDLSEVEVARIFLDNSATVTFDALPDQIINAVVVKIATKSFPGAGVNYTVILILDTIPETLFWDMTAFIDFE